VHHIPVSGCLRQSTKHPKKPALCGLLVSGYPSLFTPITSRRVCPFVGFEIPINGACKVSRESRAIQFENHTLTPGLRRGKLLCSHQQGVVSGHH
jgi:hypothetical protein